MTKDDVQTISKRLWAISSLALTTSALVILTLMVGFGALFVVKGRQQRANQILLFLEKSARNMGQVSITVESFLLNPEETAIWDERELYETSAISFLTLAEESAQDEGMKTTIGDLLAFIDKSLAPMETELETLVTSDLSKAKAFYAKQYKPVHSAFDAKINLARSRAEELNDNSARQINLTLNAIVLLTFILLFANGWILIQRSRQIAVSTTHILNEICGGLVRSARSVQNASGQVEKSSSNLAQAAGQQSASQQQTAASIEEILSIMTRNSQHALANQQICEKGQAETVNGKKYVDALKASMQDIESLNSRLENLIQVIGDIDAKTDIINDIAFQTKILSFNASVEAARSGEHGKGFAVVAEEVGKLSALSKDAAEGIKQLISESGLAVTEAVRSTQVKINQTKTISGEVTGLFDSFYRFMTQIMAATEQMMTAAMEQQTGIEQIRMTMIEAGSATEVTRENSEKLTSYARRLAMESDGLRTLVNNLRLLVDEETPGEGPNLSLVPKPAGAPTRPRSQAV